MPRTRPDTKTGLSLSLKFLSSLYLRCGNSSQSTTTNVPYPCNGSKVAAYKLERRERLSGPWTPACACTHGDRDAGIPMYIGIESEITLSGQERGKEWEYCVIAVNKAGEGTPSNTVMAVL